METLHAAVLRGKTAAELLAGLQPYLDRLETAHKNSLEKLIMEKPHKTNMIVSQTQAVRNFKILRGMIGSTIADGITASQELAEVEKYGRMSETERKFLGFLMPE